MGGISESEAKALNYLMHGDRSAGSVGIEALRQRNFVKEAVDDVTSCILPFGGKEAIQQALGAKGTELTKHLLGYASGTGVTALPGCPVRFRRMTSQQAGEILNAFCSERAWWLFTWDLLRSPPEHFEAMQDLLKSPEEDGLVGETITNMALAALRVRAYLLEKQYGAAKARLLAGNEASSGWEARRELARLALAAAVANEKFARCIQRETVEYGGWEYLGQLEYVHEAFTQEPTTDMAPTNATWIDEVLAGREGRVASVPEDDAEWLRTNYDILNGLKVGLQIAIEELRFANLVNEIDEGAEEAGTERWRKGWEGEPRWVVRSALNVPVIMTWVRRKLGEAGGNSFYSELYLERALPETVSQGLPLGKRDFA